jgi:hypothetical protein
VASGVGAGGTMSRHLIGVDRCDLLRFPAPKSVAHQRAPAKAGAELAARRPENVVQARSFAEMLEQIIRRYRSRVIEAPQCIPRKYGYPPDKQEKATQTALEQAELLSAGWAA